MLMKELNSCPKCTVGELLSVVVPDEIFSKKSVVVKCDNINCGWQGAILVSDKSMYLIDILRVSQRS